MSVEKSQCPCCDHFSIDGRGNYDICPVCGWEDDGLEPENPAQLEAGSGGPNGMTLRDGRKAFRALAMSKGLPQEAAQYKRRERNIPL